MKYYPANVLQILAYTVIGLSVFSMVFWGGVAYGKQTLEINIPEVKKNEEISYHRLAGYSGERSQMEIWKKLKITEKIEYLKGYYDGLLVVCGFIDAHKRSREIPIKTADFLITSIANRHIGGVDYIKTIPAITTYYEYGDDYTEEIPAFISWQLAEKWNDPTAKLLDNDDDMKIIKQKKMETAISRNWTMRDFYLELWQRAIIAELEK